MPEQDMLDTEALKKEVRHQANNYLASLWFDIFEFKKDQALTSQTMNYIKEDVAEIKALLKEIPKNFVTKSEHQNTISSVRMLWRWFVWAVVWTISLMVTVIFFLIEK